MQDVDYEASMAAKLSIAKKIFDLEKDKILNSSSFKQFFSENEVNCCWHFDFLLFSCYTLKHTCNESLVALQVLFFKLRLINCRILTLMFVKQEWLKPYAAFCFLRDFFETSDHTQWGRFGHFSQEKVFKLKLPVKI